MKGSLYFNKTVVYHSELMHEILIKFIHSFKNCHKNVKYIINMKGLKALTNLLQLQVQTLFQE